MTQHSWFRRFGFLVILAVLWLGTSVLYWHQQYAETRAEHQSQCEFLKAQAPEAACPPYDGAEARTSFWSGVWENNRSEYEQLLVQGLLLVALASWVAKKSEEQLDRIEAKVDRVLQPFD